jgi:hypothetical protein
MSCYRICQWCHAELVGVSESPDSVYSSSNYSSDSLSVNQESGSRSSLTKSLFMPYPISSKDFCDNGYCEYRYTEEKSKIPDHTRCAFCYRKDTHFNWTIGSRVFCNGRCIDMFNEMQANPDLLELKLKEKRLKEELENVESCVEQFVNQVSQKTNLILV